MQKKALILTYYWPPSGGAGVQRWLKFAKYLREFDWEPVIYTAENPEAPAIDESLLKDIPEGIEVIKLPILEPYSVYKRFVGMKPEEKVNAGFITEKEKNGWANAIAVWLRGNLFIPDARRFWIRPSDAFLTKYLENHKVDVIVSTGPPHTMHLIAMRLHRKTGIPWLADFRDPWTGIDYYHQLKLSRWADNRHHALERKVLTRANVVVGVTRRMIEEFQSIVSRPYKLITNGFDEADIQPLPQTLLDEKFSLAHIGSLAATRNPENLWQALAEMVKQTAGFAEKLEIKLMGKVDVSILKSIDKYALTPYLNKIDYLPHNKVMHSMQLSQVLLLLINNTPNAKAILTGKVFEYLGSGRPILCIGPEDGDAAELIAANEAGKTAGYEDVAKMKEILLDYFIRFREQRLESKTDMAKALSRRALTGKMAELFDQMINAAR